MSGIDRSAWPGSRILDEPGVLGEPARVEEERDAESVADGAHRAEVLERDRLPAARVVRDRDEHDRDVRPPRRSSSCSSAATSTLPLNGCIADGSRPSAMTRSTASAPVYSTLARVVSKWVLFGTTLPGPPMHREQDLLGGASLVRRDDVLKRPQLLDRLEERDTRTGSRRNVSSPRWIAAHWSRLMAPVPESVSRSMSTSLAWTRRGSSPPARAPRPALRAS